MTDKKIRSEIEKAIREHLVIANPQSVHYSVDRIMDKVINKIIKKYE